MNGSRIQGTVPEKKLSEYDKVKLFRFAYNHCVKFSSTFFEKHHKSEEKLELVIHCRAGVSRSSTIAKFLGKHYKVPFEGGKRVSCNPRILRMLTKYLLGRV